MLSALLLLIGPAFASALSPPSENLVEHPYGPLVEIKLPYAGSPALDPAEAAFAAAGGGRSGGTVDSKLRAASPTPTVTYKDGTVIGYTDTNVESFRGIPFAEPPLGNLRLKPPTRLTKPFGKIKATSIPQGCPQQMTQYSATVPSLLGSFGNSPVFQAVLNSGEDCLTVNVQRPVNTTAESKLPVVVWIFGGGFELGATNQYSGWGIVNKSMSLGKPIIYTAMNYRVGGWGFMPGKELQAEGSTNLGLRDQRMALEWIQDNIKDFGGDPAKVTIWGQSAGSISVYDHLVINDGNHMYKGKPLFRAAIMNSGTAVPTQGITHPKAQKIYDTTVKTAGCEKATDTLSCLRALPYYKLLQAFGSVPSLLGYTAVDLSYLPRPDPKDKFFSVSPEELGLKGKFAKVPVIVGDQEDEGTMFALFQSNLTTTAHLVNYLKPYFPSATQETLEGVVASYPDDAAAGSPFRTGTSGNWYPQFKRLGAILGDLTFTLTRRAVLASAADKIPVWSYLATYFHGTPIMGTGHGSDLLKLFFGSGQKLPQQAIWTYYIAFINNLDPNTISSPETTLKWPQWKNNTRDLVCFNDKNTTLIKDDFRSTTYDYLLKRIEQFRV
ncbi:hypothetical protein BLS_003177 [Venturia inaequalis]|uniref:Carboxylic ester hydrolase n=1 Tax=Venturia inaequalis TaxID=5025 RepID=A0A8H3UNU0_VENIN|nr:hypothetical protein BLS_003177 [Venturia inaequalis]KAE9989016.1 hypothetical protein EG328_003333 [Venturia inaequalis]